MKAGKIGIVIPPVVKPHISVVLMGRAGKIAIIPLCCRISMRENTL